MSKIKITRSPRGTTSQIEELRTRFYAHAPVNKKEKRNQLAGTRRHISLYYLLENGVDFTRTSRDSFYQPVELARTTSRIKKHNKTLPNSKHYQKDILRRARTITEIAKAKMSGKSAI